MPASSSPSSRLTESSSLTPPRFSLSLSSAALQVPGSSPLITGFPRKAASLTRARAQTLNRLESQTGVPKAYATLGAATVFTTLVFFNIAAGFLTNLLGWGLPAYFSIRALESPGHDDDVQWLTYWVIFGGFTFIENFAKVIVAW